MSEKYRAPAWDLIKKPGFSKSIPFTVNENFEAVGSSYVAGMSYTIRHKALLDRVKRWHEQGLVSVDMNAVEEALREWQESIPPPPPEHSDSERWAWVVKNLSRICGSAECEGEWWDRTSEEWTVWVDKCIEIDKAREDEEMEVESPDAQEVRPE